MIEQKENQERLNFEKNLIEQQQDEAEPLLDVNNLNETDE